MGWWWTMMGSPWLAAAAVVAQTLSRVAMRVSVLYRGCSLCETAARDRAGRESVDVQGRGKRGANAPWDATATRDDISSCACGRPLPIGWRGGRL